MKKYLRAKPAWELFQLCVMFALIEAALWTLGPMRMVFIAVIAGGLIVLGSQGSNQVGPDIGRPEAWNWTLKIAITASIIILGVGLAAGSLHKPTSRWPVAIGIIIYLFWAAVQQFV